MALEEYDFKKAVQSRYPGLLDAVRRFIQASEKAYEGNSDSSDSFLWEHTLQVTSIACRLARDEKLDPLIPAVAALFHDAGKFAGGKYHKAETIEEEESARVAERLLRRSSMKPSDIRRVLAGLRALYNEKAGKNRIAAILHDADFLSKFGALGVAAFFTKSALRGRTMRSSVLGYLSKELTYAACLPLNMRTKAGRRLAAGKASDSLKFYHSLLAELRGSGIADLRIRRVRIPYPSAARRSIEVHFVISSACPECGGGWEMAWATDQGVKCSRLNINWACAHCGEHVETSFCLPEIA
jgi:HD superfamily phosphodiesterase